MSKLIEYNSKKDTNNRCIAKDLIITFPMNETQIQLKKESYKRHKIASLEQEYDNLTEFEKRQANLCYPFKFGGIIDTYHPIESIDYFDNDLHYDFGRFHTLKRDKTGKLLCAFKKMIINNGFQNQKSRIKNDKTLYGKLDENGSPIFKCNFSQNNISPSAQIASVKEFALDFSDNSFTNYLHNFANQSDFNDHLTKSTGSGSGFVKIQSFPFGSFTIPSFKEICYTVLKEMYLINHSSTIEIIKSLPVIVFNEFIESCFNDEKPVGNEIITTLFIYHGYHNEFPLDRLLKSSLSRDTWFRFNFRNRIAESLSEPHYNDNFSIDVYDNYHLFKYKQIPLYLNDNVILKSSTTDEYGNPSIVGMDIFLSNFNKATNGIFSDTSKIPKSCYFIGGLVTGCLKGTIDQDCYKNSDIDICFVGYESEDIKQFIIDHFGQLSDLQIDGKSTTIHGSHLTISKHYPFRHVQINLHQYHSIEDVLLGVDIDSSCFAFNGVDKVVCLERSIHSMNYRVNFACDFNFQVNGNLSYQSRLVKYMNRGFNIFYISSIGVDHFLKNITTINYVNHPSKFLPSIKQNGFPLLYSASIDAGVLKKLKEHSDSNHIPYGIEWNKMKFDQYITSNYNNLYNGYSTPDCNRFVKCDKYQDDDDIDYTDYLGFILSDRSEDIASFKLVKWDQHIKNHTLNNNHW